MKTVLATIFFVSILFAGHASAETPQPAKEAKMAKAVQMQVQPAAAKTVKAKRNKVYDHQRLSAGEGGTKYTCEHPGDGTYDCECKGMLDCSRMLNSGACKDQPIWEDGDDPSIGGCDSVPEG